MFNFTQSELDITSSHFFRVLSRFSNHLWCHVHTDYLPGFSHLLGDQEAVKSTATAKIHNCFAGSERSKGHRVTTPKPKVCAGRL